MTNMDLEKIYQLAADLRKAIEKTSFSSPPMDRFPRGCCGDATIFLSEYLLENGYKSTYYCGVCPLKNENEACNPQSHAWVVLEDGVIADITGDQFRNNDEFLNYEKAVYVGKPDEFHSLFSSKQTEHIGGIDCYDEHSRLKLRTQYDRIKKNV